MGGKSNIYIAYASCNPMLVVRTQIKEILKEANAGVDQVAKDFPDRLEENVKQLILEAIQRAKANGRRTIMGRDL